MADRNIRLGLTSNRSKYSLTSNTNCSDLSSPWGNLLSLSSVWGNVSKDIDDAAKDNNRPMSCYLSHESFSTSTSDCWLNVPHGPNSSGLLPSRVSPCLFSSSPSKKGSWRISSIYAREQTNGPTPEPKSFSRCSVSKAIHDVTNQPNPFPGAMRVVKYFSYEVPFLNSA